MSKTILPKELSDDLQSAWLRFLDSIEPLRGELYRYCRRMTRTVWDAEDLVQETLLRAFGSMGARHSEIRSPRAFVFRTATNLWIDTIRRRETELTHAERVASPGSVQGQPGETRDAGVALFVHLSPHERAAVVLKDVLEFSLNEIAEILQTTTGAVKSALHRARRNLEQRQPQRDERDPAQAEADMSMGSDLPSVALVDHFVAAFNALDVAALTDLLLENVSTEVLGIGMSYGRDTAASRDGWVQKSLFGHEPWALDAQKPARHQRAERRLYLGEPLVVVWIDGEQGENMEWMCRIEEESGRIARIRDYCLCPETQAVVAEALGLPLRAWGYRLSDQTLAWDRSR